MSHETATEKVCSVCATLRPLTDYYRQARGLYGRAARCKPCCRAYEQSDKGREVRSRYERSDKGKAKARRYGDSGKRNVAVSGWRKTPKGRLARVRERQSEAGKQRQRKWRLSPSGVAASKRAQAKIALTEKQRARVAGYKESGKRREIAQKYKKSALGLECSRRHCAIRRARKNGAGGEYTRAEWLALCAAYGNRCLACGATGKLQADHVVPIAKGGGSGIANIQPLCWPCNRRKWTGSTDFRLMPAA